MFVHDAHQMQLALASVTRARHRRERPIATEVLPAGAFHVAKPYHERGGGAIQSGAYTLTDLASWLAPAQSDGEDGADE
ncbi:MAG: hypothetical protein M3071_12365 [Actinomycetota bacterium]|nr:hypothetical protein [Actinomycetota bacterium]